MLLSRVANCLYWIGRYIERAENANRHVIVAGDFAVELEGINEEIALKEWQSLVASMHSNTTEGHDEVDDGPENCLHYMVSYLIDKENPFSVLSSLSKARENTRTVGEATTFEVTYNLNEAYRTLSSVTSKKLTDRGVALAVATNTHNSILTTLGAIEHTLTRGEGWNYMKIGEAMERTQRTLYVLKTRLPNLARWEQQSDNPLYFASWRSLLRSLASQDNYRQEYGSRFIPEQVTRFLLFHPSTPRSVYCGIRRMNGYLNGMSDSGSGAKEARKRLGKLAAQLEFEQDEIVRPDSLVPFLDQALTSLYQVHEAISNPLRLR